MPARKQNSPSYRPHVSGQARVTLDGRDYYLGTFDSPASYARYHSLLAIYHKHELAMPKDVEIRQIDTAITVAHLTADFVATRLTGQSVDPTSALKLRNLCLLLDRLYGATKAEDFGPRKLAELRDVLVSEGVGKNGKPNSRSYANDQVNRIVSIFEHAVSRELFPPEQLIALRSLRPLKRGECREGNARAGVPVSTVQATLPFLSDTVAAMVRLQIATAMRPSEIFRMTPNQIDRSGDVWLYRPDSHKTQAHGKVKAVPLVGQAVEVIAPRLFLDGDELLFKTQRGRPWNKDSYRVAVTRAAKEAKVDHWTPYQIRHLSLQFVRDAVGAEATQALAGHARLDTTEIYAKASLAKAVQAAHAVPRLAN